MSMPSELIGFLQEAWGRELRSAALYRLLAEKERDERRRDLFLRLAAEEEKHARQFGERMEALGGAIPSAQPVPSPLDRFLAQALGTEAMLRRMEREEERVIQLLDRQAGVLEGDPDSRRLFEEVEREEEAHAQLLQAIVPNAPARRLEAILRREKWHVSTGSWIGDAIYGVNDGLGAVFGIVSGMAGYTSDNKHVVFAGLLGMLASALSMGASAFLASRSEREVYEAEIARERREIEEWPDHEREELSLIYQLKGFTEEEAGRMITTITARPEQFLKTMAQEELGLSDRHLPKPWIALLSAMISTAVGGLIPVMPFLFLKGTPAVIVAAVVGMLGHFAVGAAKSLVTARHWLLSGLEMTLVAFILGVVTYVLGVVFQIG